MKRFTIKSKLILGLVLLVAASALSSCLKNGKYYVDFSTASASIDLPLAAANNNGPVEFDYDSTTTTASIPVYVNVASPSIPNKSTTATLAIDTAWLNSYNNANGTAYTLLPAAAYKVATFSLTVPSGQRLDSTNVTFDFTKVNITDATKAYALPFTIASASLPIEQWNHLILYVTVPSK